MINLITVKTLGKFAVINGDKMITEDEIRSPQITKMFICLAMHRMIHIAERNLRMLCGKKEILIIPLEP